MAEKSEKEKIIWNGSDEEVMMNEWLNEVFGRNIVPEKDLPLAEG